MGWFKYPGMKEYILKRILKGVSVNDLYIEVLDNFEYQGSIDSFGRYVRNLRHETPSHFGSKGRDVSTAFIEVLESQGYVPLVNLCNELNCPPKVIHSLIEEYRDAGYEIINDGLKVFLSTHKTADVKKHSISNDKEIDFAVASDLHFGSKACQITRLNEFCDVCRVEGIKHIFVPGDIVAGRNVYKGQEHDQYATTSEEQEESVIKNLPTGFEWYMLGGNHDYSFIKSTGHNPLRAITNQRSDCHYVGYDNANVQILNSVDLKMWHPGGSVAYALSYKIQKRIDRLGIDELHNLLVDNQSSTVRILLAGHYHQNLSTLMGGTILGLMCGAFEGKTNLTERMGVTPTIGGWILNVCFNENNIVEFTQRFWNRPEIQDDYKNYNHSLERNIGIDKPVFEENSTKINGQ